MMKMDPRVHRRLNRCVKKLRISQRAIAKALGVAQPTVTKILSGERKADGHMPTFATLFKVDVRWLRTGEYQFSPPWFQKEVERLSDLLPDGPPSHELIQSQIQLLMGIPRRRAYRRQRPEFNDSYLNLHLSESQLADLWRTVELAGQDDPASMAAAELLQIAFASGLSSSDQLPQSDIDAAKQALQSLAIQHRGAVPGLRKKGGAKGRPSS